jgi:enamine deaminase RidA (YjgF/YER057c/UK114 family)
VKFLKPDGWKKPVGYTDGVLAPGGRVLFVSGQVGWNPATQEFESQDFAAQAAQALANMAQVLAAGGARPEQICRMTWYVTDRDLYVSARRQVGDAYRRILGGQFPAMTLVVVAGLLEVDALVEIEVTAVITPIVEAVPL